MYIKRTAFMSMILMLTTLITACTTTVQDQPSEQSRILPNTAWELVSLNGGPPMEGSDVTLRFGETSIEGSGGCNTYGGSYTTSGESLNLNDLYWTEMACMEPEGIMEQEQAYFQAFNAAARYRVEGDRLELYDEMGAEILAFVALTSAAPAREGLPTSAPPDLSLACTLEMDETYPAGEPVKLRFALHNQTDHPVYVLNWYTPLEGIAGDIFHMTRDGERLSYQGPLVKRDDPKQEAYITLEPGAVVSADVDLTLGYDLSVPGAYQVQFTTGLRDASDDAAQIPREQDAHQLYSLSCNSVRFSIVPAPEPPAGFERHENEAFGVSLWVPESWTIVEPGSHNGVTILQSYPQDKYIGGEPRQPGDTKCDLTIHPPGVEVADVRHRTNPTRPSRSSQSVKSRCYLVG